MTVGCSALACRSDRSVGCLRPPSRRFPFVASVAQLGDEGREAVGTQPDVDAGGGDLDPLHQKPDDAGLLGGEKFVPERIEGEKGFADIDLGQVGEVLSCGAPSGDDDLGRAKQDTKLVDDRSLDLGGPGPG